MSTGYQITNQNSTYFLTFTVIDWIDVFTRKIYRDILLDSLTFCRKNKGLKIWAYVIMSNHVHCILSAEHGNLSDIIRDLKRFTAITIIKAINTKEESRRDWMLKRFEFASRMNMRSSIHHFWVHQNHAEEIHTAKFFNQKLNYIHENPVRAGWVQQADDWLYSSARDYANRKGLIEIDIADVSQPLGQRLPFT